MLEECMQVVYLYVNPVPSQDEKQLLGASPREE